MTPLSFRARLTLRWTLSFGLLLALAHAAIYLGLRSHALRDLDAQLRTLAATEVASAVDEYQGLHLHEFPSEMLSGGEYAGKFAQVLDQEGRVLLRSPLAALDRPVLPAAAQAAALAGGAPMLWSEVDGRRARVTALRVQKDGVPYVFGVGLFTERLDASLARLAGLLLGVWAVGLGLTAALGSALAARALDPIARITRRAAAIARGEIWGRLDPPRRDDEIGRMTAHLDQMLERLQGAIAANRRFAADASHELRSPVTAIRGELEVALKRQRSDAEYRESLAFVRRQAEQMSELIENLTLLVRAQEGRSGVVVEEVSLLEALRGAGARVAALAARRGVTLRFQTFPDALVYADPRLLSRALDNLLRNAVQYNRRGGRVTVSGAVEEPADERWATGRVRIGVRDEGGGVPEAERERIFERFYRIDPSRSRRTGGAGLGLPIARDVLGLFGGELRLAESSPRGSFFEVLLPGRAHSSRTLTGPLTEVPAARAAGRRVLDLPPSR